MVYHVFEGFHHFDLIGVWCEFLFDGLEWKIVLYVLNVIKILIISGVVA
jgi:hypothetical protein